MWASVAWCLFSPAGSTITKSCSPEYSGYSHGIKIPLLFFSIPTWVLTYCFVFPFFRALGSVCCIMRPNCLKHRLKIESKLSHVYQSLVRCIKNTGKPFFLLRDVLYYKDSVIIKYMVVFDYFFFFFVSNGGKSFSSSLSLIHCTPISTVASYPTFDQTTYFWINVETLLGFDLDFLFLRMI